MRRKPHLTFLLVLALIFTGITVVYGFNAFTATEHGGTNIDSDSYVLSGVCSKCHTIHASEANALVGGTAGGNDAMILATSTDALCESCHNTTGTAPEKPPKGPPNSYRGSTLPAGGHGNALVNGCAGCHDPHGVDDGALVPALLKQREEAVCFSCHSSTGVATDDIQTQYGYTFKHPTDTTTNAHDNVEWTEATMTASNYDNTNRHAECTDCHNPHECASGSSLGPSATKIGVGNNLAGVRGVSVSYSPGSYTATAVQTASFEYEICFKCHSTWNAGLTLPAGKPDIAAQFNPNNTAYHPIMAPGTDTTVNANALINGWTSSSYMTCSDCHGSDTYGTDGIGGVHGSNAVSTIGTQPSILKVGGTQGADVGCEVCYPCHNEDTYSLAATKAGIAYSRLDHTFKSAHFDDTLNIYGIACLNCHGGGTPGGIHGGNTFRLLNGANLVHTRGTGPDPYQSNSCKTQASAYGTCGQHTNAKTYDCQY